MHVLGFLTRQGANYPPQKGVALCIRVILIEKSFRYPILHVPKLIPLLHWFQNSFCFRSRTFPSHGGSFFGTMVDLEGENGPKKAKF